MPTPAPEPAASPATPALWRLALVGVVGGLLSGLFGVGGGIVMVPLLILLAGMDQRRASATSLAAIVPTALAGSIAYLANGQVDLVAAALVALGGIVGGWIGAALLARLPLEWLRWLFIAMLVVVAVRLAFGTPDRAADPVPLEPGPALGLVALGLVVGIASGLFGVGGGLIMVPAFITVFGLGDLIARGTSLVAMIPTAVSGSVKNVRGGLVDLRIALIVGVAATLAALPGVALAFLIPPAVGGWLFAALLLAAAAQLSVRAIRARRRGTP
ncbi:sulfite exporter TauE/SafE family protein [Agromyces sp. SYSU T00266]|uniref:sulfite exporter TauE/SafE family protein n=1 Tax=Agromyces zhanjiangensis TaxID=3158562 RepID=UPI003393A495